ncbi:MAG: glycosyl hydrolase [Nonlabens sp.]
MKKYCTIALCLVGFITLGQTPPASNSNTVQQGLDKLERMSRESLFKNLKFDNIGPTIMSGRVVDVDVNPRNPVEMLVAYASGGLFHTTNNGNSFTPLMYNAPTVNLGDIAVDWEKKTIWAGTGENNASRSSYAGIGLLKSTDWGETWSNPMLMDSHHIGRIVLNPDNPDHVVVAVTGPLYSASAARGIYVTKDGGSSWRKTLYVDDITGIIDLVQTPGKFDTLYASSWQKDRKAWNFTGNGAGSAIYKSTDAGETWSKITIPASGFPTGSGVGRIGLAVYDDNIVYAIHDSQFRREKESGKSDNAFAKAGTQESLSKDDFKAMTKADFLGLNDKRLNTFLKQNGFQEKYRAQNVKNMVRAGDATPADVAKYLETANTQLFDTPVKGAELYRSNDGGKSWSKTHKGQIEDVFYSYGYYFAQVRVDPADANHVYVMGVPIVKSDDGGKSFTSISRENVHSDHHALWVNPQMRGHLINGNDGGLNISYDEGESWVKNNSASVGQFYAINYDLEKPYNVYGGLQDNGVWVGANNARNDRGWMQNGNYPWEFIMGGDGMQIQIDQRDSDIVYTGYQFGNYYRLNRKTGDRSYIQPKHDLGESPYRFNWQTPILLSSHNQDILYLGGNKLHRSMNRGDDWTSISGDLTQGPKDGNVAYGTLTTISESPLQFGLIYTGSDDGLIQITRDGGASWKPVKGNWPANLWVSRVVASQHELGTVYATLNGYRWDDFMPYVFKSTDYGNTWINMGTDLPASPVNVIIEHPQNEAVTFVGTDNATYIHNNNSGWALLNNGMPPVAVHDLKIQPESNDILVGTHGRSIYKANLDALELMKDGSDNQLKLADISSIKASTSYGGKRTWSNTVYEPRVELAYYSPVTQKVSMEVLNQEGKVLQAITLEADAGLNFHTYDATIASNKLKRLEKSQRPEAGDNGKFYLPEGSYQIKITAGRETTSKAFEVKQE